MLTMANLRAISSDGIAKDVQSWAQGQTLFVICQHSNVDAYPYNHTFVLVGGDSVGRRKEKRKASSVILIAVGSWVGVT